MRDIILQIDLSLDGFAAGANGELDWVTTDEDMNRDAEALMASADTLVLGRTAYQMFSAFWPTAKLDGIAGRIARHINRVDKLVFSRTLRETPWGQFANARLATGDIATEVSRLKAQSGGPVIVYGGAGIAASFINLGLVDEFRLRAHPVALGNGMPIFAHPTDRQLLQLVAATPYQNGAVQLRYRPLRQG